MFTVIITNITGLNKQNNLLNKINRLNFERMVRNEKGTFSLGFGNTSGGVIYR